MGAPRPWRSGRWCPAWRIPPTGTGCAAGPSNASPPSCPTHPSSTITAPHVMGVAGGHTDVPLFLGTPEGALPEIPERCAGNGYALRTAAAQLLAAQTPSAESLDAPLRVPAPGLDGFLVYPTPWDSTHNLPFIRCRSPPKPADIARSTGVATACSHGSTGRPGSAKSSAETSVKDARWPERDCPWPGARNRSAMPGSSFPRGASASALSSHPCAAEPHPTRSTRPYEPCRCPVLLEEASCARLAWSRTGGARFPSCARRRIPHTGPGENL